MKNRIILAILLSVMTLQSWAQIGGDYNPENPSDPQAQTRQFQFSVIAEPENSGSFNFSDGRIEVGRNNSLYAYANTDYQFKHWMLGDSILSTDANFDFVMPSHSVQLIGVFEYNPTSPANPGSNHWDSKIGKVIVDDFKPGDLYSAIYYALNGSSSDDVVMITVAGKMNSGDFGIANSYPNCTILDLSRVTGITEVPSYAFDRTNLESVYLPASIEKIGSRAFYNCPNLVSLTIYAMTPPELGSNVFTGVPEGLTIYIPAAAIAQYQEDETWGKFALLPIQEDIRSISVSLPAGANAQDYAQMWLELTNTKSGQHMHYIMTDRQKYSFANIIRNTSWNITLRNEHGDVFGQIDNVEVQDEDVEVAFTSLSKPQNISLSVISPDGTDVTTKAQITWMDAKGNYLAQSTGLAAQPAGNTVSYKVTLSQELAMQYAAPMPTDHVVTDGKNDVQVRLESIKQVTISGNVKDLATKTALNGAVVTASQTFAGKYSKTVSTKTDAKGNYTLTVSNVPTSLAVSASDYISQTIVCDSLMTGCETITLSDVSLKGISGAVISLSLNYTQCPTEDSVEGAVQDWYADYNNVSYSIYNRTKQVSISQFNVQYPQIVLLEEVEEGDVLEMTATSKTGAFMPVKAIVTIDAEQNGVAVFSIIELGKIKASFAHNSNPSVVGTLYDANGKLVKSYDYSGGSLTINDLVDGRYTLVSMGNSRFFSSIYDLSQLPQTGLVAGSDYTQASVMVNSGKLAVIDIDEVPTLDESKLYYTGDNTSFTVNKSSIVAGNYLTLTGHIDFKSAYSANVSNVNLIVDLPESCQFVENSVMVGNRTSSYTLQNNRITIPLARYTDRVRFCIIPTLGGDYAPSALAQFDLDGKTITQPIGSACYTAKDLSISVPSTVAKTAIPVSGTAIGASTIEIYDNNVLIGQTNSLANGSWVTTCELNDPYNLSTHNIYAKVVTKAGIELLSENKACVFNENAIEAKTVEMSFYNSWLRKNVSVMVDLEHKTLSDNSYMFYMGTDITFAADLTNNDPEFVKEVIIKVYTDKNDWVNLDASYDEKMDRWIAVKRFESNNLPVGVMVDILSDVPVRVDANIVENALLSLQNAIALLKDGHSDISILVNDLSKMLTGDIFDQEAQLVKMKEIANLLGFEYEYTPIENLTEEYIDASCQELDDWISDGMIVSLDDLLGLNIDNLSKIQDYMQGIELQKCNGLTSEQLTAEGYQRINKTDGSAIYYFATNEKFEIIDLSLDVRLIIASGSQLYAKMRKAPSGISDIEWYCEEVEKYLGDFQNIVQSIVDAVDQIEQKVIGANEKLTNKIGEYFDEALDLHQKGIGKGKIAVLDAKIRVALAAKEANKGILKTLNDNFKHFRVGSVASKTFGVFGFIFTIKDGISDLRKIIDLYKACTPCPDDEDDASAVRAAIVGTGLGAGAYYLSSLIGNVAAIIGINTGVIGAIPTGGVSIGAMAVSVGALVANCTLAIAYTHTFENSVDKLQSQVDQLKCHEDVCPKCHKKPCECETPCEKCGRKPCICDKICPKCGSYPCKCKKCKNCGQSPCICEPDPKFTPIHDPSGFVYEGVTSNRLAGVTATAFYKENVEDMYGDLYENIVKWDAEQYAQENPLFTDENGMYAWDVPQGLWQVKFEKEGYETTYSEWLPVPPPQLDVNIAMKQNRQPEVKNARAYEDAVEVEFDKYMMPELLNTDNIIVMAGDKQVEGSIILLNEEIKAEGETESFASKLRFNAAAPFEVTEVTLMINNRVKSYAGIRMQDNYSQSFTIEQEIRKVICDSATVVGYGHSGFVPVTVLPASASAGKVLNVRSSSSMILATDITSIKLDENGSASIPVSGELPGTAALTFTIDGYDLSATTIVNVEQIENVEIEAPRANIASGTTVTKGTSITLSCATEGATIYYTLDGSCPCDEATRLTYTEPIVINKTVTIKAMAVAPDMTESDIAEFTYIVDEEDGIDEVTLDTELKIYPLPVRDKLNVTAGGKTIKNVALTSMNGSTVVKATKPVTMVTLDVSSLTPGIYIINVATEDKTYSRKIMKVK